MTVNTILPLTAFPPKKNCSWHHGNSPLNVNFFMFHQTCDFGVVVSLLNTHAHGYVYSYWIYLQNTAFQLNKLLYASNKHLFQVNGERSKASWKPVFVALTDKNMLLYDKAPRSRQDWAAPYLSHSILATRWAVVMCLFTRGRHLVAHPYAHAVPCTCAVYNIFIVNTHTHCPGS